MSEKDLLLEKARKFLLEASRDKNFGCYNKGISSLWFAIEHFLKLILLKEKGSYPKRIGRMLSLTTQEIKKKGGNIIIVKYLREIYNARKNVDHSTLIVSEELCNKFFKKGNKVLEALSRLFGISL